MQILKRILFRHLMVTVLGAGMLLLLSSQTSMISREYQIKAVFLYNFTQFVDWPEGAFESEQAPLVIGVLGNDPFGTFLDNMVAGEKVKGRSLKVQRYSKVDQVKACHILFVSNSEADRLNEVFTAMKGRSILTVGESDGFVKRGGMMRFVTAKNKVQLEINTDTVQEEQIIISSKLLRLAEIVSEDSN